MKKDNIHENFEFLPQICYIKISRCDMIANKTTIIQSSSDKDIY